MVNLEKLLVRPQWEPQEILDQQAHLSLTIAKETKKDFVWTYTQEIEIDSIR
jgi:hypothetical protein